MASLKGRSDTRDYENTSETDSFNIGCLPDRHIWQEEGNNYDLGFREAEYFLKLSETYELDAILETGDFGSYDALDGFLDGIDGEIPVYVLVGDEDRKMRIDKGERKVGWKYQTKNQVQPFETATDYSLEGSKLKLDLFEDYEVWFQHKPRWETADDDLLFNIDPVKRKQDYHRLDVPRELLENTVIGSHGHTHRPQSMEVGRSGIISLGAAKNYGVTNLMPEGSVNVMEFSERAVNNIHIDRVLDQVFEVERFELEDVNRYFDAPAREEFRKKPVFSREGKNLSPLERFNSIPDEVRDNSDFNLNPAD